MRNLKKVLSLALAFVMLLGMMVVGAGAAVTLDDLTDKDAISENYREAVDLLTAIEVLAGTDQGNFNPSGNLTRDQAAKIVATLALGVDAANALNTAVAPFTDVPATSWSAGYVAYCANMGIVNGIGNGKFSPGGQVSGYQFAKMLLGVLGYGAKDEYVGSNWVLNVSRDAQTVGVSKKVNISNAPITREEAAQMAFNTINLALVSYSELIGTYTAYAWNTTSGSNGQTLLGTLAKNIFGIQSATDQDGYGYDIHHWCYIGKKAAITADYLSGTVLGTETNSGLTWDGLYRNYNWNDDGATTNRPAALDGHGVEYYINGTKCAQNGSAWSSGTINPMTDMKGQTGDANKPFLDYNGYVATIVDEDNDGDADKIVVTFEYLAQVTKVNSNGTVNLTVYDKSETIKVDGVETTEFAKDDMILIIPSTNTSTKDAPGGFKEPLSMVKAEMVTGTVTAYYSNSGTNHAGGSVTMNGTKYNYNGIFSVAHPINGKNTTALGYTLAAGSNSSGYALGRGSYNLYLDSQGNVIGAVVAENAIRDFAYIIKVGKDAFQQNNIVDVVLSDGTRGTYTVSSRSVGANNNGGVTPDAGDVYAYSLDGGNIILTELNASGTYTGVSGYRAIEGTKTNANAFYKGATTFMYDGGVAYADNETVFVYIDGNKISRFVGKDNAPDLVDATTTGKVSMAVRVTNTGLYYVEYVVINAAPRNTMTDNYIYVTGQTVGYSTDINGVPVYYHRVVKDGVTTNIAIETESLPAGVYMYSVNMDLFPNEVPNVVEAGKYSVQKATTGVVTGLTIKTISAGNVIVGTDGMNVVVGNARVIDLTHKPDPEESTLEVTDTVTVVYTSSGNLNVAKEVFITKRYDTVSASDFNTGTQTVTGTKRVDGNVALGGNLTVNQGATLYVDGNLDFNSKSITNNGAIVVTGNITAGTINGDVTIEGQQTEALTLENGTVLTLGAASGNTGELTAKDNATVTINGNADKVTAGDSSAGGVTINLTGGTIGTLAGKGSTKGNTINITANTTIGDLSAGNTYTTADELADGGNVVVIAPNTTLTITGVVGHASDTQGKVTLKGSTGSKVVVASNASEDTQAPGFTAESYFFTQSGDTYTILTTFTDIRNHTYEWSTRVTGDGHTRTGWKQVAAS